jgi:hypothetical protein
MNANLLLEDHLKTLRLATFRQQYRQVAEDAAGNNLGYDQYLLALAEQEVAQRQLNSQRQRIKAARFPVLKELADFDFSAIPKLNKQRILDLARGEYITPPSRLSWSGTLASEKVTSPPAWLWRPVDSATGSVSTTRPPWSMTSVWLKPNSAYLNSWPQPSNRT